MIRRLGRGGRLEAGRGTTIAGGRSAKTRARSRSEQLQRAMALRGRRLKVLTRTAVEDVPGAVLGAAVVEADGAARNLRLTRDSA